MKLRQAGRDYGYRFKNLIRGFCAQEIATISRYNPRYNLYLKRCKPFIKKEAPNALSFYEGVSEESTIDLDVLLSLSLHEEYYHMNFVEFMTHCSLLISPNKRNVLMGQNWDWPCRYYPWTGVTQLQFPRNLKIWTYHLPGLPIGNAMNSAGLALAWTGAGYFPTVAPKSGVPTYLILIELMLKRTVKDAVKYLENCTIAGASIIGLVDKTGKHALVEVLPGRISFDRGSSLLFRANHFLCSDMMKRAKQNAWKGTHSGRRMEAFSEASSSWLPPHTSCTSKHLKQLLTFDGVMVDLGLNAMTHDSFVFEPTKSTIWWRSGGWDQGQRWRQHKI